MSEKNLAKKVDNEEEEAEFTKYLEEYGLWKLGKHPKQGEIGDNFFDYKKLDL